MWFKEPKYAWFIIGFMWVFGFLGSVGRIITQYYQDPITESLAITRGFFGFAWSASILIGSLCAPLGGWLTDKFGYKATMTAGTALGVVSSVVIVTFQDPVAFFIGFGVLGGLAGIGASTSYVIVTQWFRHHRAKALMILSSAGSIGLAAITPIFVHNDSWLTWMTAYKMTIVIGLSSILLLWLVMKENKERTGDGSQAAEEQDNDGEERKAGWKQSMKAISDYVRNPAVMTVIFALFTCGFSMGTVEMHLMPIMQTAHVSDSMFTASLSILGVLEMVGGFVFAVLLDRMPRALALGCLYLIRTFAFVALFAQWYVSPVLFTLIFGATYLGAIPGGILLAGESLKTKSIGVQTGIFLLFHQLGGAVAANVGGLNYDLFHNYQALIGINVGLSLISCMGYVWVHRRTRAGRSVEAVQGKSLAG